MFDRWNDFERTFAVLNQLDQLRRQVEQGFGGDPELFAEPAAPGPTMVLRDEGASFVLRAELPGMAEKDVELSYAQDVLTVKGERKIAVPEGHSVHRQERRPYRVSRSFTLPARVDAERIGAAMKDGVLTVTLPKAAESQPRQIAVKAS